jgi:hypothetical protein
LNKIRKKLDTLPANSDATQMRERLSRLEGVLLWKLSAEYKPRLWKAKREVMELSKLLDESLQAQRALDTASIDTPGGFESFLQRIERHRKQIRALLDRTDTLSLAQGRLIERLAVAELERQKKRIDTYIVQARFSLAQTFDSALHPAPDQVQ